MSLYDRLWSPLRRRRDDGRLVCWMFLSCVLVRRQRKSGRIQGLLCVPDWSCSVLWNVERRWRGYWPETPSQATKQQRKNTTHTSFTQTHTPAHHSDTLAASKLTANFLCFLLEAEPGVWPVAGAFCRGGVCGAGVVMETASSSPGWEEEEGSLLTACWCGWSILPLWGSLWACDWPDDWFWAFCDWFLATIWAAL